MEKKFKCKDEVIYRNKADNEWTFGLFSHYTKNSYGNEYAIVNGRFYRLDETDILPYEGNEHLVGTTDEPDEEVRLEEGELIIVFDIYQRFFDNISCVRKFIRVLNTVFATNAANWNYAIRFSDFNPNDMEETSRHILCVKNGRIIRYKG